MRLIKKILRALATQRRAVDKKSRRQEGGYNLVEIMIVMAIIGMLIGAAGFGGFAMLERARKKDTVRMFRLVEQALVMYQSDGGDSCPPNLNTLVEKKFITKEPKDGWGRSFQIKCPGDEGRDIDLISLGKDGKEGTEDDLRSWEDKDAKKP